MREKRDSGIAMARASANIRWSLKLERNPGLTYEYVDTEIHHTVLKAAGSAS